MTSNWAPHISAGTTAESDLSRVVLTRDDKTILLNLHKAMIAVCADFISRHMEDHVALLVDIDKIIMGFEDDKPIPGDAAVVEELKQVSLQLLETKLTKILDTDTSAK